MTSNQVKLNLHFLHPSGNKGLRPLLIFAWEFLLRAVRPVNSFANI